ncbi:hypothetical protein BKA80DRAFT_274528 [Phyllosticta citrichinensis]
MSISTLLCFCVLASLTKMTLPVPLQRRLLPHKQCATRQTTHSLLQIGPELRPRLSSASSTKSPKGRCMHNDCCSDPCVLSHAALCQIKKTCSQTCNNEAWKLWTRCAYKSGGTRHGPVPAVCIVAAYQLGLESE